MALVLEPLGTLPVAAASGLALAQGALWVVADDERTLWALPWPALAPARGLALPGAPLPTEPAARKRAKPDHEALVALPDGALLALGSGSTAARHAGVHVDPAGALRPVELAPLHAALAAVWPELNLEGAACTADALWLVQRGNGPAGHNGLAELDLAGVRRALAAGAALDASLVRRTLGVDLGALAGVPLAFTDACAGPDGRLVFTAAAEASASTYHDGATAGSAIGLLTPDGALASLVPVAGTEKLEGVCWLSPHELLVCADADDPGRPSPLWRARWPW